MATEPSPKDRGKRLALLIGSPAAAALLMTMIPQNESSGRRYIRAYPDIGRVWTICDGITRIHGRAIRRGDAATPAECDRLLEQAIEEHAAPILTCVPGLRGRTNEVAAAIDLSYNIGSDGVCRSSIGQLWRMRQWQAGCRRFLFFDKARVDGRLRPVRGLTRRRHRDENICLGRPANEGGWN
jgi:lysozyme